eukprot:256606_1
MAAKQSAWDEYVSLYNKFPQNATQLMKFSKSNVNCQSLNFSSARTMFNEHKNDPNPLINNTSKPTSTEEKNNDKPLSISLKQKFMNLQNVPHDTNSMSKTSTKEIAELFSKNIKKSQQTSQTDINDEIPTIKLQFKPILKCIQEKDINYLNKTISYTNIFKDHIIKNKSINQNFEI